MKLYLAQHGEAHREEEDPERRLTPRGREEVERVARFLKPLRLPLDAVWHSGKTRAEETARLLAPAFDLRGRVEQREGLAPLDPVEPLAESLTGQAGDLLIAGHLPFLSRLVSKLVAGDPEREIVAFRFGGVAALERSDGQWRLLWYVRPELLQGA